jgi:hypothetical protein
MRSKYYIFHSLLVVGLIVIATMLIWHGTATGKNVPLNNSYLSTATNSTAITATSTPSQGSPVSTITPKPANTPVSSKIAIQSRHRYLVQNLQLVPTFTAFLYMTTKHFCRQCKHFKPHLLLPIPGVNIRVLGSLLQLSTANRLRMDSIGCST